MQLLFSSSPNPEEFKWWFISETILILMNYVICIVASFMAPKLRFHIHFKVQSSITRYVFFQICALFIFSQYFLFSTARLIVVGYQSGLLSYEGNVSHQKQRKQVFLGLPEENALIVACSWVRIYFLVMLQTMYSQKIAIIPLHFRTIPLIIERELAFYFIQDYSTKTRLWIPVLIIFVFVSIPALCATAAVFGLLGNFSGKLVKFSEWVPILCGLFFLDGLPGIVFPLFLWNYRKTWLLNNALKKRKFTRVKYTLAVRYQLEENLSFAEVQYQISNFLSNFRGSFSLAL